MKKIDGIIILICVSIALICLIGYVRNIVKFAECDFEPSYKPEIVYGIGLFLPTGCVTGWMDLGK